MRLGFAVKVLRRPGLKSHDTRRWQNHPHLSVSLAYLRDILRCLVDARISMYRMASDLAPYVTHPDLPEFHGQIEACAAELAEIGRLAQDEDLRLSFHPSQHVLLNSPDSQLVARSSAEVESQTAILDAMHLGPEAVVVVHLGGLYGDREAARERFVDNYLSLSIAARRRLVLENDDTRFSVSDTLWVWERTGVPLVFDYLHHRLNGAGQGPMREALAACLATWPPAVRPKVHFSSPRTELVAVNADTGAGTRLRPPRWSNHSDFINPFEFIDFLRAASGLPAFDVMLEVKTKDLALLQLRRDLVRFAPDLVTGMELITEAYPEEVVATEDDCDDE